jgi:hypothetical protein
MSGEVEQYPAVAEPRADATAQTDVPAVAAAAPIAPAPPGELCQNCNAPLAGHYCAQCGQRHEPHVHSMREFGAEAFESVTHADSRVWRTLWLLISKPGFLTREFVEGRRARYLPPFRLYLVLSVILFLVVSTVAHDSTTVEVTAPRVKAAVSLEDIQVIPRNPAETPEQRAARICDNAQYGAPDSMIPRLKQSCRKVILDDGQEFANAMLHNIPRALFLLLPLLALVMRVMYWRRYYVEHLLFFIHNHAFTFTLYALTLGLLSVTSWAWLTTLGVFVMLFYPPIYTYKAMRRVYAQGRWITRLKFVALASAYFVFIVLLATVTSLWSLVTL